MMVDFTMLEFDNLKDTVVGKRIVDIKQVNTSYEKPCITHIILEDGIELELFGHTDYVMVGIHITKKE